MPDIFDHIEPALVVVRAYQQKYHRVPGALVDSICDEIAKLPLSIQCGIYQWILVDYSDIPGHFVDSDDDDDPDDDPSKKENDKKEKPVTVSPAVVLEHQRGYQ